MLSDFAEKKETFVAHAFSKKIKKKTEFFEV